MKINDVCLYRIQVQGLVEEEDINLTSPLQLAIEQEGEASTTVTIQTDQSGIVGLIRHLHRLGLVLLSMSSGNESVQDTRFKI